MNNCLFASLYGKNGGDLLLVDCFRLWRSHWEDRFPRPLPLLWGGASEVLFSPFGGKRLVTALRGIAPIGAFPVGASFLVGTKKGLFLVGSENPENLLRCLF